MTKRWSAVALWLALAACGGKGTAANTPAGEPAPEARRVGTPCDRGVAHLFAVVAATDTPEDRDRAAGVFVRRCTDDGWSAEVHQCMLDVKAPPDADRCEQLLTPKQRDDLARDLAATHNAAGVPARMESGKPKPD